MTCSNRYFNCSISGTSTDSMYNLIKNFVSLLKNVPVFYHYLEGVYITILTFVNISFINISILQRDLNCTNKQLFLYWSNLFWSIKSISWCPCIATHKFWSSIVHSSFNALILIFPIPPNKNGSCGIIKRLIQ